jgi:hypothetical protein
MNIQKGEEEKNMKKMLCLLTAALILAAGAAVGYCDCNPFAYPDQTLTGIALEPGVPQPDPEDIQITVGAVPEVIITPTLQVVPEDVGSVKYLTMFLYLPEYGVGVPVHGEMVALDSYQMVNLLPPMDLSPYAGLTFVVYYGYFKANGDIMYNTYTVKVKSCDGTQ